MELLDIMPRKGVARDLISYNSAIDACGKSGRSKSMQTTKHTHRLGSLKYFLEEEHSMKSMRLMIHRP